ncbi:type VI secretion system protein TssA [Rhodopila globiformis]|uniref:type VI secretion system protein TssA n=1 Tax=Rhodopila globiformis TaxID=1071 RepID=UPI001304C390|nr:type VI secretion system protein TssA [Rhodopila globiformis]
MNLPEGFDLDALLAPISPDAPQGIDVREDRSAQLLYNRMRDARSEARAVERELESYDTGMSASPPDPAPLWRMLRDLGTQLLTERTKDLEIAAWLTESLVRSNGLRGLAAGSHLIEGLATRYWDVLYPSPDEYGMETRVAPLAGLCGRGGAGTLAAPLFRLVLFRRPDGSPVALYQYQASARLPTMEPAVRQQRIDAGIIPFEDLENDARTVGRASLAELSSDAAVALASWSAMAAVIDAKAGADAPAMSSVRDIIQELGQIAGRYVPQVAHADSSAVMDVNAHAEAPDQPALPSLSSQLSSPQNLTRDSALQILDTISDFFRRTEPHSPLSYTLAEAVRRARMPWLELLDEVIADRSSRDAFLTNLGIRPPPSNE